MAKIRCLFYYQPFTTQLKTKIRIIIKINKMKTKKKKLILEFQCLK